ncbi:recombinase family protein [Escherichia coli]
MSHKFVAGAGLLVLAGWGISGLAVAGSDIKQVDLTLRILVDGPPPCSVKGSAVKFGNVIINRIDGTTEFERELIAERTTAGLASARARGRNGGRPYKMTPVKLRLAMASMGQSETKVSTLCQELGITRQTLYRHISPVGQLRADGIKLLNRG